MSAVCRVLGVMWPLSLGAAAYAAGPTGLLNDTGQILCNSGGAMAACSAANTGDASPRPGQDGRFGRDAASPPKLGGGAGGFDFTRICWNGQPEGSPGCVGTLIANTSAAAAAMPAIDWACTHDHVTNLIWSLQSGSGSRRRGFASLISQHDADGGRCGGTGWRVPTVQELRSIVHYGISSPAIDGTYFPGTASNWYWTNEGYAPNPSMGWLVHFSDGRTDVQLDIGGYPIRLVRSGQ